MRSIAIGSAGTPALSRIIASSRCGDGASPRSAGHMKP